MRTLFSLLVQAPSGVSVLFLGAGEADAVWGVKRARQTKRLGAFVPREPPLPRAFASRTLLGVVVPGPGVPGRRERGWGSLAPIPREGPRGLTLRFAGAARLTRRGAARGARTAAVPSRLWSAAEGHGADSGAGLNI